MKKHFLYVALVFGFFVVNAQEFETTSKYTLKNENSIDHQGKLLTLEVQETSKEIATISIANSYSFDELQVSILENPALKNISEVIKVELVYNAYSVEIDTYYYLVTNKGNYIALPKVTKTYDDATMPIEDYIFPIQNHGEEETIVKVEFKYTKNYTNKVINVLQRFRWNDDDFDSEEAVTAIR